MAAMETGSWGRRTATPKPTLPGTRRRVDDLPVIIGISVINHVVRNTFTVRFKVELTYELLETDRDSFLRAEQRGEVVAWRPAYVPDPLFVNVVSVED